MTRPVPADKLRLGGMALRNGLLVHGPTHWAAAVRAGSGEIQLASGRKPRLKGRVAERLPGVRGVVKLAEVEAANPLIAVLLEPMLGVTMAPTMASASEKINVIPSRARLSVDCRVPPGLGEDHALARIHALLGEDGFEIEFQETVVGNRSPIDTPLMNHIQAFVEREDPGADAVPVVLPGFSDSRWFRSAFPDCTAYGFFPQRKMDLFEAMPLVHGADERVPVEDLGLAASFYAELAPELLG